VADRTSKKSDRNLAQQVVRGKLDEETIQQAVDELIQILLYADKNQWTFCPQCRKKVPVPGIGGGDSSGVRKPAVVCVPLHVHMTV
jgi:hypothetical protein